jgi:CheY-like chemotaxis protein
VKRNQAMAEEKGTMSSRIIVIDDDEAIRLLCLKALDVGGHRVSCTGNPLEALAMLDDEPAGWSWSSWAAFLFDSDLAEEARDRREARQRPVRRRLRRLLHRLLLFFGCGHGSPF